MTDTDPGVGDPKDAGTPLDPTPVPRRTRIGRLAGRARRLDGVALAAAIAVTAAFVKLAWPRFTWFGDNAESFFPLWRMVGTALRHGHWLGFDPTGFAGANIVGEAAYGMFNPVTLANAVLVSFFDELARASFLVMTEFLVLLGLGVRRLALSYGAHRSPAFLVGLLAPFSGFTLYWGASNWASGLMALTWVVWTWGSARRYVTGAGGPLSLTVFGGLAVTVGNPYALLGVVVVLAGMTVELLRERRFRRLGGLVVAGLCIGGCVLLTYLPLIAALPVGIRVQTEGVSNVGYMAPSLGDLVGLSSPNLLPQINAWGLRSDVVPSVYLSWLVLPLLPWLRWRAGGRWGTRLGLLVPTAVFTLMTLGPDQVWMFRWPLRLIEYSWVGMVVCLAVLLSAGLTTDGARWRATLSALVVGFGFFMAWSSKPQQVGGQLAWTALVAALVAGTLALARWKGLRALAAAAVVGTMIVTPVQAAWAGWDRHPVTPDWNLGRVSDLERVRTADATYRGNVYQMADLRLVHDPAATQTGHLTFGDMLAAAGHPTVNRYTGISFLTFMENMSLNYRDVVRSDWPVPVLYKDVPGYHAQLIDVLGVDTLVLSTQGFASSDYEPRPGWEVVQRDADRIVLRRVDVPQQLLRATPTPGIQVVGAREVGTGARLTVRAEHPGTVLLNRLAWPGYRAQTADGRPVPTAEGSLGLLQLTVPEGTSDIHVSYEIPGLRTGLLAVLLCALVAAGHQVWWWASRRRSRRATAPDELFLRV